MEVPTEIHTRYLTRRKEDLEKCLMNFQEHNFSALEKVGHQLKGNGLTFGYQELSRIGSQLESAAAYKNEAELQKAINDFSCWVAQHFN